MKAGTRILRMGRSQESREHHRAWCWLEEARRVFSDPYVIIREDRVMEGEERWQAIVYVGQALLVVHTIREHGLDTIIRIISARKATRS